MDEERRLIDKLLRIEALFAGAKTDGERAAAAGAAGRIRQRLREAARLDPPVEMQFSVPDDWSRRLLVALLRRYDVEPYRYRGQRRTTVMAYVSQRFVDDTLWPEFQELNRSLRDYLAEVTERVITQAIHSGGGEQQERERAGPRFRGLNAGRSPQDRR